MTSGTSGTKANESNVAMVVGVGNGISAAIARRFAREGYAVGLVARTADTALELEKQIRRSGGRALAVAADAADATAISAAFARISTEFGTPNAVTYNAAVLAPGGIVDGEDGQQPPVTPEQFELALQVNCVGAFLTAREALPAMLERGSGTLMFTGGGIVRHNISGLPALATSKHALQGLAGYLAEQYSGRGVHVAHVVVDGPVDTDHTRALFPDIPSDRLLPTDAIAETYWQLHTQPPGAWTFELDLHASGAAPL